MVHEYKLVPVRGRDSSLDTCEYHSTAELSRFLALATSSSPDGEGTTMDVVFDAEAALLRLARE